MHKGFIRRERCKDYNPSCKQKLYRIRQKRLCFGVLSPKVEEPADKTGWKRKVEEAGEVTLKTDLWPPMVINSTVGTPGMDAVWGWLGMATLLPTTNSHSKTPLGFP